MTLIALDPGVTTGYVLDWAMTIKHGQVKQHDIWRLLEYARNFGDLTIVCESFQYRRQQLNAVLTPVEIIGVVKEFQRQHPEVKLHFQTPAQAKSYWNDERLKNLELWFKGEQHARDAARHLLYYKYFGAGKGQYGKVSC